jgi:hypothetical protein
MEGSCPCTVKMIHLTPEVSRQTDDFRQQRAQRHLMSKVTTRELMAVEAEQNHRGRCFPKDTSKREISHALYETD